MSTIKEFIIVENGISIIFGAIGMEWKMPSLLDYLCSEHIKFNFSHCGPNAKESACDIATVYRPEYNDHVRKCLLCESESGACLIIHHFITCKYAQKQTSAHDAPSAMDVLFDDLFETQSEPQSKPQSKHKPQYSSFVTNKPYARNKDRRCMKKQNKRVNQPRK
jgi:hypothetical protein